MIPSVKFNKIMLVVALLCLPAYVTALRVQRPGAAYDVVQRGDRNRQLQAPAASPQVPSFDGDLDKILALALERASNFEGTNFESEAPSVSSAPSISSAPTVTPVPTRSPVHSPNVCPGAIMNRLEVFNWKYTIETVPDAVVDSTIGEVEEILQEKLIPLILSCNSDQAREASIVAIDSTLPRDEISTDTVCAPELSSDNVCTAVDGTIRMFLSDPGRIDEARELAKAKVEEVVKDSGFVDAVGTGLVKIILVDNTANPVRSGTPPDASVDPGFGTFSVVIFAVGGAALIAFVGSVYYWKQGGDSDGDATQAAGNSLFTDGHMSSSQSNQGRSFSPFSEMLPNAYRFNDNMSIMTGQNMSPVMEDEAASPVYSDEEAFDMVPRSIYSSGATSPDLLGARKRAGGQFTAGLHISDMMSDADSTRGPDSSSDTSTSQSSRSARLGAQHRMEDVNLLGDEPKYNDKDDSFDLFGERMV